MPIAKDAPPEAQHDGDQIIYASIETCLLHVSAGERRLAEQLGRCLLCNRKAPHPHVHGLSGAMHGNVAWKRNCCRFHRQGS